MKKKKIYIIAVFIYILTIGTSTIAFAATDDPLQVINNLSDYIFNTHDPSQRAQGILSAVGGILIACSKYIINAIIG